MIFKIKAKRNRCFTSRSITKIFLFWDGTKSSRKKSKLHPLRDSAVAYYYNKKQQLKRSSFCFVPPLREHTTTSMFDEVKGEFKIEQIFLFLLDHVGAKCFLCLSLWYYFLYVVKFVKPAFFKNKMQIVKNFFILFGDKYPHASCICHWEMSGTREGQKSMFQPEIDLWHDQGG